jgi:hypothetical protein
MIVGLVWALWHLPLFLMVGTSQHERDIPFMGFLIQMTASSILYTWLYNNTQQSLWSAILPLRLGHHLGFYFCAGHFAILRAFRHSLLLRPIP